MNYYIKETINGDPNAGSKARNDISDILHSINWSPVTLHFVYNEKLADKEKLTFAKKATENLKLRIEWAKSIKKIGAGDTLLVQFPVLKRPVLLAHAFSKMKHRGAKLILLVHDLELLRYVFRSDVSGFKKKRITFEEKSVLNLADHIIVHNARMKEKLIEMGFDKEKLIELGIFDYLIPGFSKQNIPDFTNPTLAIAGTLRPQKTRYLQNLPSDVSFDLYGIGYEDQGLKNIIYHGAFPPEILPREMKSSFGLVWDGDSADTCSGVYGEYLKINNPHKTSLYLASEIPVIIWKEAALAEFITDNGCGFTINSLSELSEKLGSLSVEDYHLMIKNVKHISALLRDGYFTKKALSLRNYTENDKINS